MTTLKEAAQIALDALEDVDGIDTETECVTIDVGEVIEALRAALAQPELEPVADMRLKIKLGSQYGSNICGQWFYLTPADDNASAALTAHTGITAPSPREWVGLTEKEILADDVLRYHFALNGGAGPISKKGRAIIDAMNNKLKEKNSV